MDQVTSSSSDQDQKFVDSLPSTRELLDALQYRLLSDGTKDKPIASDRMVPWVLGALVVLFTVIMVCILVAWLQWAPKANVAPVVVVAYGAMLALWIVWMIMVLFSGAGLLRNPGGLQGDMLDGERRAESALLHRLRLIPGTQLRELGERIALQVQLLKFRATAVAVLIVLVGAMEKLLPGLKSNVASGAAPLVQSPDMSLLGPALLLGTACAVLFLHGVIERMQRLAYVLDRAATQVLPVGQDQSVTRRRRWPVVG